jgi:hypothetical protein
MAYLALVNTLTVASRGCSKLSTVECDHVRDIIVAIRVNAGGRLLDLNHGRRSMLGAPSLRARAVV